jgi:endonuclease YncB( thermonuclease family)
MKIAYLSPMLMQFAFGGRKLPRRLAFSLRFAVAAFAPVTGRAAASNPPATGACPAQGTVSGRVTAINERLELTLEDGRVLKLAGLDPPHPTPDDPELDIKAQQKLANWLVSRNISFRAVGPERDRWGRTPAFVFAGTEPAPLSVNESVLDAGLARFEPAPEAKPCRLRFLAAEAAGRAAALGLWSDPYYAVINAQDPVDFAERTATFAIVEGEVTNVESNAFRTTLFFGPRGTHRFSVTILQRNVKIFEAAGLDLRKLLGQSLRVRGLLDTRFGPQIEIASLDEIEMTYKPSEAVAPTPALASGH